MRVHELLKLAARGRPAGRIPGWSPPTVKPSIRFGLPDGPTTPANKYGLSDKPLFLGYPKRLEDYPITMEFPPKPKFNKRTLRNVGMAAGGLLGAGALTAGGIYAYKKLKQRRERKNEMTPVKTAAAGALITQGLGKIAPYASKGLAKVFPYAMRATSNPLARRAIKGALIGAGTGAAIGGVGNAVFGSRSQGGMGKRFMRGVGKGAVGGAVGGAVIGGMSNSAMAPKFKRTIIDSGFNKGVSSLHNMIRGQQQRQLTYDDPQLTPRSLPPLLPSRRDTMLPYQALQYRSNR